MSSQAIPPLITQPTPTPEEQFRLFQESQEKLYIHDIFKRAMSRVIKQEKEGGPSIDIRFIQTNQKVEIQAENTKTRYEFISDLSQLDNRDLASCVETILKLNQKIIDEQRVKNLIVQRREPSSSRKPPFRPLAPSSRPPMLPQTSSSSSSSSVSQSFASPASLNQSLLSIGQLTNPDFRPSSAPQPQQQPGLGNSTQPHSASLEPFQILSLSPQPHEPLRSQLTTSSSA